MTWEMLLIPLTKYPLITVTWLIILLRIFRPMRASDGKPSNTLTGLFCVTLVVFVVVIVDSINDRPNVSSQTTVNSTRKGTSVKRSRRGGTAYKSAKARSVAKEKYGILGMLWVGFALLYLLSHRGETVWTMGLRFLMAIRGKFDPLPDEDGLDKLITETVNEDPSPENKEWAIRMTLAKKGVVTQANPSDASLLPGVVDVPSGDASDDPEGTREGAQGVPSFMTDD